MISYTWGDRYIDVMRALDAWCSSHGKDPETTRIWICSLCVDQYHIPEHLDATFGLRVEKIGMLLPLLMPWESPKYIGRLWCLFEFHTASTLDDCAIDMIFAPEDVEHIRTEGSSDMETFEEMLDSIDCEKADASVVSDRDRIRQKIMDSCGFNLLDTAVREKLRKLFMAAAMAQMRLMSAELAAAKAALMIAGTTWSWRPESRRASTLATQPSERPVAPLTALPSWPANAAAPPRAPAVIAPAGEDGGGVYETDIDLLLPRGP